MKQQLSEQKITRILKSTQIIEVLAECIKIEHMNDLIDTKFRQPAINSHAKKIKESSQAIQTHLSFLVKNKDKGFFADEYALEIHRVLSHFIGLEITQIREFMDSLDSLIEQTTTALEEQTV